MVVELLVMAARVLVMVAKEVCVDLFPTTVGGTPSSRDRKGQGISVIEPRLWADSSARISLMAAESSSPRPQPPEMAAGADQV